MTQEDKEPIDNIMYAAACGIKNTKIITEEEKQLLLKDICARLPYGVKVKSSRRQIVVTLSLDIMTDFHLGCTVKPYLRPLSSMTEEEKEYIKNRWCYEDWDDIYDFLNHYKIDAGDTYAFTDWLNEHHFDYRGLIRKGLALEAPKDMYKIE